MQIGVRIKQVVAHIFEYGLDVRTGNLVQRYARISNRRLIHQVLAQNGLAGQQRRAPAKARRKTDLGILHRHQRVEDQLIEGAIEVAATVKQALGNSQRLVEFCFERRTHALNHRLHWRVGRQQVGEYR